MKTTAALRLTEPASNGCCLPDGILAGTGRVCPTAKSTLLAGFPSCRFMIRSTKVMWIGAHVRVTFESLRLPAPRTLYVSPALTDRCHQERGLPL